MERQIPIRFGAPVLMLAVVGGALLLAPSPTPATAAELAEVAVAYIKTGQPTRGLEKLRAALALEPQNYRANFVAATYYVQTKQFDRAAPHLKAALQDGKADPDLLFTIGAMCQGQQQYVDAVGWYRKAQALAPNDPKIAYNMGILHIEVMDYPKAKTHLETYLRLAPDAPDKAWVEHKLHELTERIGENRV